MHGIGTTTAGTSSSNAANDGNDANATRQHAADNPTHTARSPAFENLRPRHGSQNAHGHEASSSSQVTGRAIPRARLPLAGYLHARASIRKTIDAQDAAALIDAQDTLTETRAILHKGRGNAIDDNEKTDFDASGRSQAALERLTSRYQMGSLFKVIAIHSPDWPAPAGFA